MANRDRFGPDIVSSEDAQLQSLPGKTPSESAAIESYQERRFVWVSQPAINGTDTYEQPPRTSNDTHSESLTRLQTGYLRAIAALEARNSALGKELHNGRIAQRHTNDLANIHIAQQAAQLHLGAQKHIAQLQERNNVLSRELNVLRSRPSVPRVNNSQRAFFDEELAKKNKRIQDKNTRIIQLEDANRQLQNQLIAERKRNQNVGASATSGMAGATRRNGNPSHTQRRQSAYTGGTANPGMARATGGDTAPMHAQKKRKFDPPPGSHDNPLEL
ncbi:hypothetical protein CC86DRAFT_464193 [Ophiobolus disseminans]|uniref:Uncharacterized protein n=1 Tax=Ophiobolus disseminans TaxID=1469910 RepID=A0A6A7A8P6_9PLEO|nr:hypothetical protein CC86DRAFT_464193 [Ophiobolus disseminans]